MTFKDEPDSRFVAFVESVVGVINKALANVPADRVRLHACWGNSESPHDSDVPLSVILPAILQAKVGGFFLPFANGWHAQIKSGVQLGPPHRFAGEGGFGCVNITAVVGMGWGALRGGEPPPGRLTPRSNRRCLSGGRTTS